MVEQSAAAENIEIGHQLQSRFDFYLVALTFTILGLAIETSSLGSSLLADIPEIIAWISLLISGLAGLSRLAWLPQVYQLIGYKKGKEGIITKVRKEQLRGRTQFYDLEDQDFDSLDNLVENAQEGLDWADSKIDDLKSHAKWKYKVHTWCLYAGLVLLVVGRAAEPVRTILSQVGAL